MAKRQQETDTSSSKGALIAMTLGAIVVAGLVVWALTRTVQTPAAATDTAATAQFPTTTAPTNTAAGTTGAISDPSATATAAPIASTTAPITATSTAPPPVSALQGDKSEVRRISAEDLREKIRTGSVVVVDVRDAASYASGHIAGALHIPMASVQGQIDLLPKGKEIVTYCT